MPEVVDAADSSATTRDRIRAVAEDLYVLRGYDGFSFGDIAEAIGTTRANIHHHFGSKRRLVDELIEHFAADAKARIERHWLRPDLTIPERLTDQLQDLERFYKRFNRTPQERNVWSPLSRLRHDLPVLGAAAVEALEDVNRTYQSCLRHAFVEAVERGELIESTPVDDLVRILRVTLLACPPMTQDSGSFSEIEKLFLALNRTIAAGWNAAVRPTA